MSEYLRINFNQVFRANPDGTLEPKAPVELNGVRIIPGVKFRRGAKFGKVDLFEFVGTDLALRQNGDTWVIHGHYAGA